MNDEKKELEISFKVENNNDNDNKNEGEVIGRSVATNKIKLVKSFSSKPSKLKILRKSKIPSLSKIEKNKNYKEGEEEEETANIDKLN